MRFYSFRHQIVKDLFKLYTYKEPHDFRFGSMGYFTTNFIPLQITAVIFISSLIFLSMLMNFLAFLTLKSYKKKCCRILGLMLPSKNFFRTILYRVFLESFLEIFFSAFISLYSISSLKEEFDLNAYDGLSASLALALIIISGLILIH